MMNDFILIQHKFDDAITIYPVGDVHLGAIEHCGVAWNSFCEMIRKDKSPFWVALGDRKIEHFLNRRKFEAATEGWYYSQSKKAVFVKYANPKQDTVLTVSFEDFDLIGM